MSKKPVTYRRLYERSCSWKIGSLIIAVLAVALAAAVWIIADGWLKEYEGSQSIYAAREYFDRLLAGEVDAMYESEKASLSSSESPEDYREYVLGLLEQGAYLDETPRRDPEGPQTYTVKLKGGGTIEFTLEVGGSTRHGYDVWKTGAVTAKTLTFKDYTLVCPENAEASADGVPLTKEDITASGLTGRYSDLVEEGIEGLKDVRYSVKRALRPPVFSVKDSAGRDMELEDADGEKKAKYIYDTDLEKWKDSSLNVIKQLAKFTVGRYAYDKMQALCVKNSPAANYVSQYQKWRSKTMEKDPAFKSMQAGRFTRLDKDRFICEVKGQAVGGYKKNADTTFDIHYLAVFKINGKNLLLEDCYTL
ncbi:MAG: hypothetical protein K5663_06240 [Clostridiales bacterium]|nr:hypothetical protein [Clostridiales bacterium]